MQLFAVLPIVRYTNQLVSFNCQRLCNSEIKSNILNLNFEITGKDPRLIL